VSAQPPVAKTAGFLAVAKAVFWSFFGVRRRSDHEADSVAFKPVHVVIAGIIGGALFVFILIVVVRVIVAGHGSSI